MSAPPALVLAAGLGTRLFPLTLTRAKPAAPVAHVPLLLRILGRLAQEHVRHVVINLHHHPESIARIAGDGSALDLRIRYSWEGPLVLGSAGGPRHALEIVGEDEFLIVNGDTMTDLPLAPLLDAHHASGAEVTMALVPNREPLRYGGVIVGNAGTVIGFTRRGDTQPSWHFVGLQVARARVFASLADGEPAESVGTLYRAMIAERPGSVRAWCTDGEFVDVGTPADYLKANLQFAAREGRALPLLGHACRIAPTARVDESVLWDEVAIGDEAALRRCVVADGVTIPTGVRYVECAIAPAPVGGAPAALPASARVEHGLIVAPLDPYAVRVAPGGR